MIIYVIIAIIILFAAIPFSLIQQLLNSIIVSVNVVLAVLTAIVNSLIQLLLGAVYGIVNVAVGSIYNLIDTVLLGALPDWQILTPPTINWVFELGQVDFAALGFNVGLSPIGTFLNTILNDVWISNAIGFVGFAVLAIAAIYIGIKARKR